MTHSAALVRVGLRIGRWILPWVAVVFASATIAYAINGAMTGGFSAGDRRPDVQVAVSTGEPPVSAAVEGLTTSPSVLSVDNGHAVPPTRCEPISYGYGGYVDTSIVAETRKIDCGWAP